VSSRAARESESASTTPPEGDGFLAGCDRSSMMPVSLQSGNMVPSGSVICAASFRSNRVGNDPVRKPSDLS
jgi:hypothetical protein